MNPKYEKRKYKDIACARCTIVTTCRTPSQKYCARCRFFVVRETKARAERKRRQDPSRQEKFKVYQAQYDKKRDKVRALFLQRRSRIKNRLKVLRYYGGMCCCCGEEDPRFLAIDHINGGGTKHRKSLGVSNLNPSWFIKNKFPKYFQVLCHNCNMAKGFYGTCPHKGEAFAYPEVF